jgi:hypothetical protein
MDKRSHERFEVMAEVQATSDGEVHVFTARNLSVGGIYLEAGHDEHAWLAPGQHLDLTIALGHRSDVDATDAPAPPPPIVVNCRAKVLRRDPGDGTKRPPGFGVVIQDIDPENVTRLRALIARATRT